MAASIKPGFHANKKAAGSKTSKPLEELGKSAKADPSVLSPAALMALGLAGVAVAAVPDKSQNTPPVPKNETALSGAGGFSDRVAEETAASVAPPIASDLQLQLADLIDDLQAQTVLEAAAPGLPTVPSELASPAEVIAPQQPYQADLFAQLGDGAAVVSVVAEPVLLAQASVPAAVPQAAAATAAPIAAEGAAAGAAGAAAAASILPAVLVLGVLGAVVSASSSSSSSANAIVPDTIAPIMKSMVSNAVAKTITLTFSETIDAANLPDISKFAVSTGGAVNAVKSISATGAVVTLTLTNVFADGTRVDLSYTDLTSGNDAKAIQDAAGNDALGFSNLPVADGYVRGASVYADANNNGQADAGELIGTTDAGGNFFLPIGTKGSIIAVGGVNIDTGVLNTIDLKAPEGSTTVNPLTTLVQAVVQANGGTATPIAIATAMATVATSLGLTGTDLLKYDPISAFTDAAAGSDARTNALAAQKAATQVATIVALAEKAAPGAGATVVSNLATVVKTAATSGTPAVNLSASTTIDSMIGTTLDKVSSADKTAARDSISRASTAISEATDLTTLSLAQGQALDKIAPAAPTSVVVASISNDPTPAVRVNLDTNSLLGRAANVGDIVTLSEGTATKATGTLTAADIAAGYKTVDVANASALADGDHSLSVLITDRAGNVGAVSAAVVVKIDTAAPTVALVAPASFNGSGGTFTFNFSESVAGFEKADITVVGGTASTFAGSGASYTSVISPTASTTPLPFSVNVLAGAATDAAGNASTAATAFARSILVGTSANETLTVDELLNNVFLNAGGFDIVKLSAATGSTATATDVVSGFGAGDKIDLAAILGSATGGAAYTSTGFADTGAGFIELKNLALVKNTGTDTTTVTFDIAFDAAYLGGSKIKSAIIDLVYDYAKVASGVAVSPNYSTDKVVWSEVATKLSLADDPGGTPPNGKIALLSGTGASNPIIIEANAGSGVVLSAALTVTGLVNTFQIGFDAKFNGGATEISTEDKTVYGGASGSGGLLALGVAKTAGASLYENSALEIVTDTTALGTVGDNQLRMWVAAYDTANGLTHLQMQYDTNSTYGTGKITASSIIAMDFVGDVTALLTPASLTFI